LEGIAVLAGFDQAGGAKGYRPVDHSHAIEASGGQLSEALRASWLPKLSIGWFFRAESFFPVARYLDEAAIENQSAPPDFLSHSHGEGFLRLFAERCQKQGLYIFDEPESALSPSRQIELLKILCRISESRIGQVIMATHSPVLMACPDAHLLQLSKKGLTETTLYETEHFRLMRAFCADPAAFIAAQLDRV
jgi:predicted ATPase